MHHTTSPTTGTSTTSPANHNSTPQGDGKHCRSIKKAIDISDGITLIDRAQERVRHHWRKKKTNNGKKQWIIPPDVAQLVTQALTVARAHLIDYRDQIKQERHGKQETVQGMTIPSEEILHGLHPFYTLDGEHLQEPHEPIEKIKSVRSLLLASQDDQTAEFMITASQVGWSILLLSDLVQEAERRAVGYQEHCRSLYLEVQNRLKSYDLAHDDRSSAGPRELLQEGRK